LSQIGDAAIPALLLALADKNSTRRQYAAYAIANMAGLEKLTKNRDAVALALVERTQDEDRDVVWHAVQAIGSVRAAPKTSVDALVSLLKRNDAGTVEKAAEALGEFGAEAKAALPALIGLLERGGDAHSVPYAIRQIGLDRASAEVIGKLDVGEGGLWLLVPLFAHPDVALEFLRRNPHVVDVPARDREVLVQLLRDPKPELRPLKELLFQSEHIPLAIMATLGDPRFLPLLERRLTTASPHHRTQISACARACGARVEKVIEISESRPGDFKPKSAWPGVDSARQAPGSLGHGDGITEVIITGQIVRDDGSPVVAPKFFRLNDAMLLGERLRHEEPIAFDARTGRFTLVTMVFAAYSMANDQPEPGPYQTGSSLIQIESPGCRPLQVQFYDEMPDVLITLTAVDRR
jgi:hypothetical protein